MPALLAAGHTVTGTTRSSERAGALADAGATPVIVAALDAPSGVYNVVGAHPAPRREWLPAFAAALGAPPPRHVPAAPVKLLGGRPLVTWQEAIEGQSNARAKEVLHWTPVHGSWRTAFRDP